MSDTIGKALQTAANLCRHFEGFRSRPYICPAGYPTIGYGTVYKPDGSRVTMQHEPVSRDLADLWLLHTLKTEYLPGILKASPQLITEPEALGALTDFAYNLGVPRYRASTLCKRVNQGDWPAARYQLGLWVYGGGKVLPGLQRRRRAEASLLP
jgi:lysozyme